MRGASKGPKKQYSIYGGNSPKDSKPGSPKTSPRGSSKRSPTGGSPKRSPKVSPKGSPKSSSPKSSPKVSPKESPKDEFYWTDTFEEPNLSKPEKEYLQELSKKIIDSLDTNTIKLDRKVHYSKTMLLETYRFSLDVIEQMYKKYYDEFLSPFLEFLQYYKVKGSTRNSAISARQKKVNNQLYFAQVEIKRTIVFFINVLVYLKEVLEKCKHAKDSEPKSGPWLYDELCKVNLMARYIYTKYVNPCLKKKVEDIKQELKKYGRYELPDYETIDETTEPFYGKSSAIIVKFEGLKEEVLCPVYWIEESPNYTFDTKDIKTFLRFV